MASLSALAAAGCSARLARRVRVHRRAVLADKASFGDRVSDETAEQRARANGVVVARDHVVDDVGVTVRVDDGDDGQAELASLR